MAFDQSSPAAAYRSVRPGAALTADRVVTRDSLGRVMLAVAAQALGAYGGQELDRLPDPPDPGGAPSAAFEDALAHVAAHRAVPWEATGEVDAEMIAAWIVAQYARPAGRRVAAAHPFPAAVLGSPHGSAAHLAATLGAPWLPTGFELAVTWPDGTVDDPDAALRHGIAAADRLRSANPGIAVRQVHDPVLRGRTAGTTVALFARWRRVPRAYQRFLSARLAPGAPLLVVSDVRPWPVFDLGGGLTFQLGGPTAGLEPEDYLRPGPDLGQALRLAGGEPRRWHAPRIAPADGLAEHGTEPDLIEELRRVTAGDGRPLHQVRYGRPSALSVAVAEVTRDWLAEARRDGSRLVVECGRLLDPTRALRCGLVPYWCEGALRGEVSDAEWWLAGSRRFDSVDVIVEPPGRPSSVIAPIPQWRALAWFGRRRGSVDRTALRSYPYGVLPTRHAARVLGGLHDEVSPAPSLPPLAAVTRLADVGRTLGLADI
jgi:hypothetical protein